MRTNRQIELKVKIMSLAAEQRIIRRLELQQRDRARDPIIASARAQRTLDRQAAFPQRTNPGKHWTAPNMDVDLAGALRQRALWATAHPEAVQADRDDAREASVSLRSHRKKLGVDARIALLAYGFIRGRSYARMERDTRRPPDLNAVQQQVARFLVDAGQMGEIWREWRRAAEAYLNTSRRARQAGRRPRSARSTAAAAG